MLALWSPTFQLLEYQWREGRFDTLGKLVSARHVNGQHPVARLVGALHHLGVVDYRGITFHLGVVDHLDVVDHLSVVLFTLVLFTNLVWSWIKSFSISLGKFDLGGKVLVSGNLVSVSVSIKILARLTVWRCSQLFTLGDL